MFSYEDKRFRPVRTSDNGEASADTTFHYRQSGNVVTAHYEGGRVRVGHLVGLVDGEGRIDVRYHHVNDEGALATGTCQSVPERLPNGKIRLHETWQWTSGDRSAGTSVVEET